MQNVIKALKAEQLRKLERGEEVHILDGRSIHKGTVQRHDHAAFAYAYVTIGSISGSYAREWIYTNDEKDRLIADLENLIGGARHVIDGLREEMGVSTLDVIRCSVEVA